MSELREALSSAFDSTPEADTTDVVEAAPAETPTATAEPVAPVVETTATEAPVVDSRARDASGKFTKAETSSTEKPAIASKAADATGEVAPLVPGGVTSPEAQQTAEVVKPPQSWKATVREKWSALPPEVQQEVSRREREMSVAMQETAEARKFHEQFKQTVSPFEMMIRAEGADPIKAVGSLLQTAAALRTAPPVHKAQLIASMVKAYGVPLEALAAAIDGQPQTQQAQGAVPQFQDPRVDQLLARLQAAEQQRQQQTLAQHQAEIQKFQTQAEFLDDVREDMADLIEAANRRGREMSLQQAYDVACKAHPEISEVLKRREAAKSTVNANASTQRSKAAASSVRSHPTGGGNNQAASDSIRASIEAAMATVSGR